MLAHAESMQRPWEAAPEQLRRIMNPSGLGQAMENVAGCNGNISITRTHFSTRRPTVFHAVHKDGCVPCSEQYLLEFVGPDAHHHCEVERKRLAKSRRAQIGKDDTNSVFAIPDLGLVGRRAGLDAKLPGLRLLKSNRELIDLCARALGTNTSHLSASVSLRTHRLGKRAVMQVDVSGKLDRCLFIRLRPVSSDSGAKAFSQHRLLATCFEAVPGISVPAPLVFDRRLGAAVYGAIDGGSLELDADITNRHASALVQAVEAFTKIRPGFGIQHSGLDELAIIRDWGERLLELYPHLDGILARILEQLEDGLSWDGELVPSHRDLHEGQIVISSKSVGILDFDTYRLADPALDAGNIIAHLRLRSILTKRSLKHCESAIELSALQRTSAERLKLWTDASLFRLAGIYGFTSSGLILSEALLQEISE